MRRYYSNGANGLTKAQKTLPPELKEKILLSKSKKKKDKKKKPSAMMLAMRDKRNIGASKALEKDQLKKREEKFSKETKKFEKRAKEAKQTPGTPDDGYKRDYSNIPSKPNPKFK